MGTGRRAHCLCPTVLGNCPVYIADRLHQFYEPLHRQILRAGQGNRHEKGDRVVAGQPGGPSFGRGPGNVCAGEFAGAWAFCLVVAGIQFDYREAHCPSHFTGTCGLGRRRCSADRFTGRQLSGVLSVAISTRVGFERSVERSAGEFLARRGLVIFQFMVSLVLIFAVIVVYRQLDFVQSENLGYDRSNVLYFDKVGMVSKTPETF